MNSQDSTRNEKRFKISQILCHVTWISGTVIDEAQPSELKISCDSCEVRSGYLMYVLRSDVVRNRKVLNQFYLRADKQKESHLHK